jgi:subtilisin-like proprotein convertase family protein
VQEEGQEVRGHRREEEELQEEEEEVKALVAFAGSAAVLIAAPVAGATTYNNDAPIIIPTQGNATPYPSSITVSGTAGPITDVNVGLDGFTHANPYDVGIVLVAPGGQALMLLGCVGDGTDAAGVFLTFDSEAAGDIGAAPLSSGTFKPSNRCGNPNRSFPAPGPLASYGNPGPIPAGTATFASVFGGQSPIGTWNLYVRDFAAGEGGSIPGGWSLDVNPDVTPLPPVAPAPAPAKKCKRKKKAKKGASAAKRCKKKKKQK